MHQSVIGYLISILLQSGDGICAKFGRCKIPEPVGIRLVVISVHDFIIRIVIIQHGPTQMFYTIRDHIYILIGGTDQIQCLFGLHLLLFIAFPIVLNSQAELYYQQYRQHNSAYSLQALPGLLLQLCSQFQHTAAAHRQHDDCHRA